MSIETALSPETHLLVVECGLAELTAYGWTISNDVSRDIAVRFLRGKKMRTSASLFDEVAAALQFPHYFGENWSAFDECITDLSWLPASGYMLLVTNSEEVLRDEDDNSWRTLISILQEAGEEWGHLERSVGSEN